METWAEGIIHLWWARRCSPSAVCRPSRSNQYLCTFLVGMNGIPVLLYSLFQLTAANQASADRPRDGGSFEPQGYISPTSFGDPEERKLLISQRRLRCNSYGSHNMFISFSIGSTQLQVGWRNFSRTGRIHMWCCETWMEYNNYCVCLSRVNIRVCKKI